MTNTLVIIGSGLAAYTLAKNWRKLDQESTLVIVTQAEGHFYSKPQLSIALTQKKTPDALILKSVERMRVELNADIITHTEVTAINRTTKTVFFNDTQQRYTQLVLAQGSMPLQLPCATALAGDIISINQLEDYRYFYDWLAHKKHIAIVGAGLVGCEFMNDIVNTGREVSMVSFDKTPLPLLIPAPCGENLQQQAQMQGVKWYLGQACENITKKEEQYQLHLASNTTIRVDGVLSAVGLKPHADLARRAGLAVGQGILVDSYCRSSDPDIYALGDCAEVNGRVLPYIAPLLVCARALAHTLCGEDSVVSYPVMPVVIKTSLCPIVVASSFGECEGRWHYEGSAPNLVALYYDDCQILRAYVLMGEATKSRAEYHKKLQDCHSAG